MGKKTVQFLKKVSKGKALDALEDIETRVIEGKIGEAFDLLRNEYRIGPDTIYGSRNRTFLFMLRELYLSMIRRELDVDNALLFSQKFIESGVNVNHQDIDGVTLLHLAAYDCYSKLCRLLLDNGAKTDIEAHYGKTPLEEAINGFAQAPFIRHYDESISVLLLAGADPDRPSEEPREYRSPRDAVVRISKLQNPESPEECPIWKVFFNALDQFKERNNSRRR